MDEDVFPSESGEEVNEAAPPSEGGEALDEDVFPSEWECEERIAPVEGGEVLSL